MNICKYRGCKDPLDQRPGQGGRKKEFCNDQCRQAEHRARIQDESALAAEQEVRTWGTFQPATLEQIAGYISAGSRETARKMADLFLAEQQAGQGDNARVADLERELAHLQTRMDKQFIKKTDHKADLTELEQARVDLRQLRKEQGPMQEEIHQLMQKGLSLKMHLETAQERIKNLELERTKTTPVQEPGQGLEQVQESYRQYVATTNERISQMSGELARYRQEQESGALPDTLAKMERMRSQIAELESKLRWQEDANHALARSRNEFLMERKTLQDELARYCKEERLREEMRDQESNRDDQARHELVQSEAI
jgi:chromosome segregation ATPase